MLCKGTIGKDKGDQSGRVLEGNEEGEYDQGILYACMKILQLNP